MWALTTWLPPHQAAMVSVPIRALQVLLPQAAFTAKELREVLRMPEIFVELSKDLAMLTRADEAALKASRSRRRVVELLQTAAGASDAGQ